MSTNPSEIELRPELLLGPNPFIEAIPAFTPFEDWGKRLRRYPLDGSNWQAIKPAYREALLSFAPQHFVPISTSFEPAACLQKLLRRSFVLRNPILPEERRRTNIVSLCEDRPAMLRASSLDAAGSIWSGMTGTGKSSLAKRILEIIAPDQVIKHGPSSVCGWERLDQVVWLYVDHASNGTRGGLLKRILICMDGVLGTDYSDQYRRSANIDTLLAMVCRILSNHRVALLVIDEKQQSSFEDSPWNVEFILFYLSLMNLGISVVLIGNPLAFPILSSYAQVLRRFSVGGIHNFEPAPSANTPWWCEDYVPRMRRFSLIERIGITKDERDRLEFDFSGGLQGLYPALHVASQEIALRRGGDSAELLATDIENGARSPTFVEARNIALAVLSKGNDKKMPFTDIPPLGKSSIPPTTATGDNGGNKFTNTDDDTTFNEVKRLVSRYRSEQTRRTTKLLKQLEVRKSLSPEDLRLLGTRDDLLEGATRTMKAVESSREKTRQSPQNGGATKT